MNEVYRALTSLVDAMTENRTAFSEDYDLALDELKRKTDASSRICQIVDFEKYSQIYFNPVAVDYFGISNEELLKMGFQYVFKYLHPENFDIIRTHLAYFANPDNYDRVLSHVYYVNTKTGWRWLYNCTKVSTYTKDGKAKYLFVVGTDISDFLEGKMDKFRKLRKNLAFVEENAPYFEKLTSREKEILHLIVSEKTARKLRNN
ncbi:MAG: PAS domain-containing protein [Chitinophagales bacterium]